MRMTAEAIEALDFTGKRKAYPVEGCGWLYLVVNGKPGTPVRSWVLRYRYKTKPLAVHQSRFFDSWASKLTPLST